MAEEISRKTLSVLVVLVVMISLVGTFVLLNQQTNTKVVEQIEQKGTWSVTILPPEKEPERVSSEGKIALTVLPPEK